MKLVVSNCKTACAGDRLDLSVYVEQPSSSSKFFSSHTSQKLHITVGAVMLDAGQESNIFLTKLTMQPCLNWKSVLYLVLEN